MSEESQQFDVGAHRVAGVYAKAFLGAAAGEADVAGLVIELENVVDQGVRAQPEFRALLANQLVSAEEKVQILDRVFGGRVAPLVLNFLKVVAEQERLIYLPEMAAHVRELYDESQQRRRVEVTTAAPMDGGTLEALTGTIRARLGCEPNVVTRIDPSLIGGVVIRVGDRVFDGSVTDRMRRMREDLHARYAEAIETRRQDLVAEFTEG
ncbi:MAG: ATP synthase F1 subunit delta [Planctomycetota bacterium]|nr:MAG: ATP synthase F1 subunit delta [Planctomycetota bacterium]REJ87617.1 MAG: ATP synthase F1 subunit delta [Planctomycetota bacterium]REK30167.1 MAG: ATP synthase F1 subunit delta [Planctomycetota bacterium]REK43306.1 MAG: ATP synthase F1 subunit delta [Planctomycetota bacterium]